MDILITGAQASGKTETAQALIAERFGVKTIYDVTLRQLLVVTPLLLQDARVLAATIRTARVEAVLVDECTDLDALCLAIRAVNEARVQMGRNLFAVYCYQYDGPLEVASHVENINLSNSQTLNTFK